jgi:hypothetical protein
VGEKKKTTTLLLLRPPVRPFLYFTSSLKDCVILRLLIQLPASTAGHIFQLIFLQKYVKIPPCLPAGKRYSGEPHVLVSADTRQKSSFVNSLKTSWGNSYEQRTKNNEPFNRLPNLPFNRLPNLPFNRDPRVYPNDRFVKRPSEKFEAKAGQSKITNYAKQSQFAKC